MAGTAQGYPCATGVLACPPPPLSGIRFAHQLQNLPDPCTRIEDAWTDNAATQLGL